MKKYLLPIGVGVAVFGGVTAFAASLTVNSSSLGAGNSPVASCNSSATVSYDSAPSTTTANKGKYVVTTVPVATDGLSSSACANMSFRVSLLDASNNALAEKTGTLSAGGAASLDFTSSDIPAHDVENVAVVITG